MQFFTTTALLAGIAVATPILERQTGASLTNCTTYASVDSGYAELCIPSDCDQQYIVQPGDTCETIASDYNTFTESILYYWNPLIGQTCEGLQAYVPVCISTPWYTYPGSIQDPDGTVKSNTVPTDLPVPVMPNIDASCTSWELVGDAQSPAAMIAQNGITDNEFLAWNPDAGLSYAWLGYWCCVGNGTVSS